LENRQLVWVSSSQKDLEEFPDPVKETMLFALDLAKVGGKHGKESPLKAFPDPLF
jgi:phage-related protein